MIVEIPPEFEPFVRAAIDSGSFQSEAEVVGEALRLFRQRKLSELRRDIDTAAKELDRGEGIDIEDEEALGDFFEDIKNRGRKRLEAKRVAR